MTVKAPKKLIEVALPLDDINIAVRGRSRSGTGIPRRCICGGRGGPWRRRGRCCSPRWSTILAMSAASGAG